MSGRLWRTCPSSVQGALPSHLAKSHVTSQVPPPRRNGTCFSTKNFSYNSGQGDQADEHAAQIKGRAQAADSIDAGVHSSSISSVPAAAVGRGRPWVCISHLDTDDSGSSNDPLAVRVTPVAPKPSSKQPPQGRASKDVSAAGTPAASSKSSQRQQPAAGDAAPSSISGGISAASSGSGRSSSSGGGGRASGSSSATRSAGSVRSAAHASVPTPPAPSPPTPTPATELPRKATPAPAAASSDAGASSSSGSAAPAVSQAVKAERAEALRQLRTLTPEQAVADRHHWLVVTVPEKPTAGADCVVYFNRNQSDALRHRPRVQLQYGFNHWELAPGRVDLQQAAISRDMGADFWSCTIKVPEEAYEVNLVFSDGEGAFENNGGADFCYPAAGSTLTWEQWQDLAAERRRAEAEKQLEAERAAAAEADRAREAAGLQQDEQRGRARAEELLHGYAGLQDGAVTQQRQGGDAASPLTWYVEPAQPAAGHPVRLLYNAQAGPLHWLTVTDGTSITLKYGFNGWKAPKAVSMRHLGSSRSGGIITRALDVMAGRPVTEAPAPEDWWEADLEVPFEAAVINFVVNYYDHYDNNGGQDYKLKVGLPRGLDFDSWILQCAESFKAHEHASRTAAESEARQREAKRAEAKRKSQEAVYAVERRKVRHVLFTEPEVLQVGQEVTVYYNPHDTPLNGRSQIYLTGSWNRWTHPRPFGPLAMAPPERPENGEQHWKATVKIPPDAYMMDFVFSDVESGPGTYDNRGGFDYHFPVTGCPVRQPPLHIVHIAVEMAPIAKVGGLGDVVTALGRAVQDQGHLVEVCLPRFDFLMHSPILSGQLKYETEFDWGGTKIYVTTAVVENLRVFFIEPKNGFFATNTVYGRYDDEVRFDFFCKAALEFLLRTGRQPDILHCHDWSTAHVAKSFWQDYHPYGLSKPRVVFTIHNLDFGQKKIGEAAFYCQRFTTVSPTYAFETGGHPSIGAHVHKLWGIRNGIDPELWDPSTCQWLPLPYSEDNVLEGKAAAKKALRERLGMTAWGDKLLIAVVSRLTEQKGVHLIKHTVFRTLDRGGQFVLLGSAPDPRVQAEFNDLASRYGGENASFQFKYDEPLSHLIYAAADCVVVPSMFEPCGLTQMIAMRYGSVPIVRHTGGLKDTVFDVDFDKGRAAWELAGSSDWQRDQLDVTNGFAFEGTDPGALDYALNRAIDAWYNDREWFRSLQRRVMSQDWSWNRPALDYIELYHQAKK